MVTEQKLVNLCRRGDREAQRELYERTSDRIYRLLLRMAGNPDDAFDLAQDTYVKAFSRIEQFDGRSSVETWLYRVAVNEALQHFRRTERIRARNRDYAPRSVSTTDNHAEDVRLDIGGALSALSPSDRAMLLLRYQEGLDYRAIAEVCDCAEGTVASRLNRARRDLRSHLQKSYGPREARQRTGHPKSGSGTARKKSGRNG